MIIRSISQALLLVYLAHVIIVKAVSRSERNYEEVDRKLMGLFFSIKAILKNWKINSRFSSFLGLVLRLTILKSQIQKEMEKNSLALSAIKIQRSSR